MQLADSTAPSRLSLDADSYAREDGDVLCDNEDAELDERYKFIKAETFEKHSRVK